MSELRPGQYVLFNQHAEEMTLRYVRDLPNRKMVEVEDGRGRHGVVPYAWLLKTHRPGFRRAQRQTQQAESINQMKRGEGKVVRKGDQDWDPQDDKYEYALRRIASIADVSPIYKYDTYETMMLKYAALSDHSREFYVRVRRKRNGWKMFST